MFNLSKSLYGSFPRFFCSNYRKRKKGKKKKLFFSFFGSVKKPVTKWMCETWLCFPKSFSSLWFSVEIDELKTTIIKRCLHFAPYLHGGKLYDGKLKYLRANDKGTEFTDREWIFLIFQSYSKLFRPNSLGESKSFPPAFSRTVIIIFTFTFPFQL